jgi:hypothetical protein
MVVSAPMEFDVEPREVPASHLVVTRCCVCGVGGVLAAPGRARLARCIEHLGSSVIVPRGTMAYGTPVGYPNPFGKGGAPEIEREAYPAPEPAARSPWPSAVEKLAHDAAELGWTVGRQSARGCFSNRATGRPGAVCDSFALTFRSGAWPLPGEREPSGRAAYAVYAKAGWQSICMYGPDLPWFLGGSVTDLREFLAAPDRDAAWFDAIRARNTEKAARAKLAAAVRPKAKREGAS